MSEKLINLKKLKIAYIKSSAYQDLWVYNKTNNPIELFKSTIMRCPPIGLTEYLDIEFIIVDNGLPERFFINQDVYTNKCGKNSFLDESYHNKYTLKSVSHKEDSINWNLYNIVITINHCVTRKTINQYPNILWCYLVGENDGIFINKLYTSYDLILNQDVQIKEFPSYSIGFPYTFLGKDSLYNIHKNILNNQDKSNKKNGLFVEINNNTQRPVVNVQEDFYYIGQECNIPIILHSQNIIENLNRICNAKYFVKLFGRKIRGNGIIESISAGTLVLINSDLIVYKNLIPIECDVKCKEDVIKKILYLENNHEECNRLMKIQKDNLEKYFVEEPLIHLYEKYDEKIGQINK
jgi:hypothetical protein